MVHEPALLGQFPCFLLYEVAKGMDGRLGWREVDAGCSVLVVLLLLTPLVSSTASGCYGVGV
jgi:hypothetical protein